jgi:protein SCO1/2
MLVEPAFVVGVAAYLWRRALRPLTRFAGWRAHACSGLAGAGAAALAMSALFAYGRPTEEADVLPPFPGERIRTQLAPPDFTFVDQQSNAFSLSELRGRVVVLTGIYARCSLACPEILLETKALLASLPADVRANVSIVAVSLNPEEDTQELMGRITAGYGFTHPEFRYLNGEPRGMHDMLTALGFARVKSPVTGVIDHANLFLVLDAQGRIAYRFTLNPRHRGWLREAILSLARETST